MVSERNRHAVIISTLAASFIAPFLVSGQIVATPAIGTEFGVDPAALSWLGTAFFITATAFLIPFGKIADLKGMKRMFRIGAGIYAVAGLVCGLAPGYMVLLTGRLLAGIGAAIIFSTTIALLSLVYPPEKRGQAIGINITAMVTGLTSGFLIGGFLSFYIGWRSIFLVTVPIALCIVTLVTMRISGECALAMNRPPGVANIVFYIVALGFIMAGLSYPSVVIGAGLLIIGIVFLAIFYLIERHAEARLIDFSSLKHNHRFLVSNIAIVVYFTGAFAVIFLLSLYLQLVRGLDARTTGLILVAGAVSITPAFFGGKLSDRFSRRYIAIAGIILTFISYLLLVRIGTDIPIVVILISLVLGGLGAALFQPSMANLTIGTLPREQYGFGSGAIETMRLMGNTLSMALVTLVFGVFSVPKIVTSANPSELLSAERILFSIYAGLCIVAFIIVIMIHPRSLAEQ